MPELPEVETVKRLLEKSILRKKISKIRIIQPSLRWKIDKKAFEPLIGMKITKIKRRGKYILLIAGGKIIIVHLGMSGYLRCEKNFSLKKHDHVLIEFGKLTLIFNDTRRFGSIHVSDDIDNFFLIKNLGVEPLEKEFDCKYLRQKCLNRIVPIKEIIMNQNIVVGIGNIYATEALYRSKIHPASNCSKIDIKKLQILIKNIRLVLRKAIELGGTTIRDFKTIDGKPGYFKQKLRVYQKDHCPIHKTIKIKNIKISGRSSFYCELCQNIKL